MQFDTTEWPEYYRHLIQLAQSEPRLVAQAAEWTARAVHSAACEPRLVAQAAEWTALAHVFLVLGTSSVVYPAAGLPRIALERGARVLEINLEPAELSLVTHISLRGRCGKLLPQMIAQANEHEN